MRVNVGFGVATCALAGLMSTTGLALAPLGTAFTYQGQLRDGGIPVDGVAAADLRFRVWDSAVAGLAVTGTRTFAGVTIDNGLFTSELDFGVSVFDGDDRWLEVEVAVPAGSTFVALVPRQRLAPTPYALQTRGIFVDELKDVGIGTTSPLGKVDIADGDAIVSVGGEVQIRLDAVDDSGFAVGPDFDLMSGGKLGMEFTTVPEGSVGRTFNITTGSITSAFGTSNLNDGAGFINVRSRGGETIVQLWADKDGFNDGDAEGQIKVRSFGGGLGGELSVQNDDGIETIELLGGASAAGGTLQMFGGPNLVQTVLLEGRTGNGGRIVTSSEDGFLQSKLEPDINGEGVFVAWQRTNASTGMIFDGNFVGTGNPRMSLSGAVSTMTFNTNALGNASVSFPANAISSGEILNEAGAASSSSNNTLSLTGAIDTILSRTITVPSSGFVLVIGSCQANGIHTTGAATDVQFAVSDTPGVIPSTQDVVWRVPAAYPTGAVSLPVTVQAIFPVSSGAHTFYFLGKEVVGVVSCNDMTLSMIYVPTAYGAVVSPLEGAGLADSLAAETAPLSAADIETEQAEAKEFNRQRVRRELQEMQTQMQAMQAHLDQLMREQRVGQLQQRAQREQSTISPGSTPTKDNVAAKTSADNRIR